MVGQLHYPNNYSPARPRFRPIRITEELRSSSVKWVPIMGQLFPIQTLLDMSKLRDNDTGNHNERVGELALCLAKELQPFFPEIDFRFLEEIKEACYLHDIGKASLTDEILHKPGKLTQSEFTNVMKHTVEGANILIGTGFLLGLQVVWHHHERWDGTGYPSKLIGNSIPLEARICSVADVYDSLRVRRPYKEPLGEEETFRYLEDQSGKMFDPKIIEHFPRAKFAAIFSRLKDESCGE